MAKKRTRQQKIKTTERRQSAEVQAGFTYRAAQSERATRQNDSMMVYDFSLIKRDLLKTITISGLLIAGLIWLSFYLR